MLNEKSGLSRYRIEKLVRCVCADLTVSQAALLLGLNRETVNRYYGPFRAAIAAAQEGDLAAFSGIVEVDESFFGAERVRGHPGPMKRGRGTLKQPVFGIFERGGRVYTEVIPNAKAPHCGPLSGAISRWTPCSSPMAGPATTALWTWARTATCGSTSQGTCTRTGCM